MRDLPAPTRTEVLPPPRWPEPLRIGPLELASRFTLAPLAGYTNLPFRRTVRELGGLGLATTDLVNARAILEGSRKTMELLATCAEDRPLAVQIFGSDAGEMCRAAQWLEAYGAAVIDINMGCPVRKVVRGGGGSAMLCDPGATIELVRKVVESVRLPVTVKMRLGWDRQNLTAPYFARQFERVGVAAVTIHGRTREQGFSGPVDLDGIRAVVDAVERIPVIGNGDVRSVPEAERMFRETGCSGIAIGRGALANPWLFRQLADWSGGRTPRPGGGYFERLEFMRTHMLRLAEWRGEHFGCLQFRKIGNWYARSLRVGRELQQTLVRLESVAEFEQVVERLREQGPPPGWHPPDPGQSVPVPAGPIAHW
ncbi:MAG TPA: tRNA dihydrouridine synthase DusB [Gemmataceae bacterium]